MNIHAHCRGGPGRTQPGYEQAADLLDVSPRAVTTAKQVLDKGCAAIQELVEPGEPPVNKATKIVAESKVDYATVFF
jgi:hypothetical protein